MHSLSPKVHAIMSVVVCSPQGQGAVSRRVAGVAGEGGAFLENVTSLLGDRIAVANAGFVDAGDTLRKFRHFHFSLVSSNLHSLCCTHSLAAISMHSTAETIF